eukprot:3330841-Rhodomonas_salina.2
MVQSRYACPQHGTATARSRSSHGMVTKHGHEAWSRGMVTRQSRDGARTERARGPQRLAPPRAPIARTW